MKKQIKNLAFLALLAGAVTGCTVSPITDDSVKAGLQADNTGPCESSTQLDFNLDMRQSGNSTLEYAPPQGESITGHTSLTVTDPYFLSDCICEVEQYVLEFDFLPANPSDIYLVDGNGNSVNFTESTNPITGDPWFVVEQEDITTEIYVVTDDNLSPKPDLVNAGGLCMIENLSNPNPTPQTKPFREAHYDENGEFVGVTYWIPTKGISTGKLLPLIEQNEASGNK